MRAAGLRTPRVSTRRDQTRRMGRAAADGPCRWCGGEVPKRRLTFCSAACVHEWKLRTDPGYLREQVFARDRGVCALCGIDTEALRKDKRKLDYTARRQFEKDWGGRRTSGTPTTSSRSSKAAASATSPTCGRSA